MTEKSGSVRRGLNLYHPAIVWILRILVGAVFILSGFVKGVDPWGSCIKIGEYFAVWEWDIPSPLIASLAFLLAGFEFIWGSLLLLGCYKRVSVWLLSMMMLFMLPLTFYIAVASPVDDCGCFGDAIILSNTATFVKNIFISLGLVYLLLYNRRVEGLYVSYVQWIIGGIVTIYIFAIELYGYNIQPMIDFRRFAEGTDLLAQTDDGGETVYDFIYEKDGEREAFTIDNLPDSTWSFVDRVLVSGTENNDDGFVVLDDDGDDISGEIIDDAGQFIITVPDITKVDLSCTYLINELNEFITGRGGSLVTLIGSDSVGVEWWKDISMAGYDVYTADPKLLKELARGNAAVVYLDGGIVKWKRTLGSISYTLLSETPSSKLLDTLDPDATYMLKIFTVFYLSILFFLFVLDRSGKLVSWHLTRKKLAKNKP